MSPAPSPLPLPLPSCCKCRYRGVLHAFSSIAAQQGLAGLWRGSLPAVQRAALVNLGELTTYDAAKRAVLSSGLTGGDNLWAHALSSVASGFCASVVSTPADVVKTRLMAQDPHNPVYRGMLHCFSATLRAGGQAGRGCGRGWDGCEGRVVMRGGRQAGKQSRGNVCQQPAHSTYPPLMSLPVPITAEGWRGLYAGFLPTWGRLGPWQLTFWVTYEQLRKASGLAGF
jgi:hypothetical protein